MNTFYKLKGQEIEKIETVKDKSFIERRQGTVYESLDQVPIPDGYKLEEMEIVPTEETIKRNKENEIKQQLSELDREAIRPLRAKLADNATEEDEDKLLQIEEEASRLREELRNL